MTTDDLATQERISVLHIPIDATDVFSNEKIYKPLFEQGTEFVTEVQVREACIPCKYEKVDDGYILSLDNGVKLKATVITGQHSYPHGCVYKLTAVAADE